MGLTGEILILWIDKIKKQPAALEKATYYMIILLRNKTWSTECIETGKYKLCPEWGLSAQSQGT